MRSVRELRSRGLSPAEIARALGVRPAAVAGLVRAVAAERAAEAPERGVVGCWVSPGWSEGLTIDGRPEWADPGGGHGAGCGLVSVLVARRQRYPSASVCGYLIDVWCLGVKDALGPRRVDERELPELVRSYFAAYDAPPVAAPIELARELTLGAAEYARQLGFAPHRDFERARDHLGRWSGPTAITFGRDGKPMFMQGSRDDAGRVLRTLEERVGRGNFHFMASTGPALAR